MSEYECRMPDRITTDDPAVVSRSDHDSPSNGGDATLRQTVELASVTFETPSGHTRTLERGEWLIDDHGQTLGTVERLSYDSLAGRSWHYTVYIDYRAEHGGEATTPGGVPLGELSRQFGTHALDTLR